MVPRARFPAAGWPRNRKTPRGCERSARGSRTTVSARTVSYVRSLRTGAPAANNRGEREHGEFWHTAPAHSPPVSRCGRRGRQGETRGLHAGRLTARGEALSRRGRAPRGRVGWSRPADAWRVAAGCCQGAVNAEREPGNTASRISRISWPLVQSAQAIAASAPQPQTRLTSTRPSGPQHPPCQSGASGCGARSMTSPGCSTYAPRGPAETSSPARRTATCRRETTPSYPRRGRPGRSAGPGVPAGVLGHLGE